MRLTPLEVGLLPLAAAFLVAVGCEQRDASQITTDMHEDFEHDHEHVHGDGHDHDHHHADHTEGAHSHPHSHPHRHGEPLHGGRIVSIGHTHHRDEVTHYHAEVLPLLDGAVTLYLLTESPDGELIEFPVPAEEFAALIGADDIALARNVTFAPDGDDATTARFIAKLDPELIGGGPVTFVVPRITLDGNRLSFRFPGDLGEDPEETKAADTTQTAETTP